MQFEGPDKQPVFEGNYMEKFEDRKDFEFYPGKVIRWWTKDWRFYFEAKDTTLEVLVLTDSIFRFRYSVYESFEDDFSYATPKWFQSEATNIIFSETDNFFSISTHLVKCFISKSQLKIKILNAEDEVIMEDEKGFHWQEEKNHGGYIVLNTNKLEEEDQFFGLGDKTNRLNLRGSKYQLWGVDHYAYSTDSDPLYKNIPFFIGLRHQKAYGVFFDNTYRSFFDFGHERNNAFSFWAQGGEMRFYYMYGPKATSVCEQYTWLTGKPELPPLWALGYQQSKWSYFPENVVRNLAQEFRSRKIPCDVIHLDIDYMDGYRCFTWDDERFPSPQKMISDLKDQGFKVVNIVDPGIKIDKGYHVYEEGLANDYFCKRADGPLFRGSVWPGLCYFPDFTNPKVRNWWSGLFQGLIEDGVSGFWNDMNEPAVFEAGTFPFDIRHDYDGHPCSHRKAHNVYGMQMARATYEGQKRYMENQRPFNISRSAYAGIQRYSSVWTGDNVASWEHLKVANRQIQRLSTSGISFCGTDIGGFIDSPSGELFTRWIQLALFHPFFRTHSSGDHGDKEPWVYGPSYERIVRRYIELRYELLPYIYSTFWQYVTHGTPMIKSLFLYDQTDIQSFFREDEFVFGDNFLVCPVVQKGVKTRKMYFPKGEWFSFWNDERVKGSTEKTIKTPLTKIPMFIKAGAIIPLYPKMQFVGEKDVYEITLHVYHKEGEAENTLYEDSGDGYEYKKYHYRLSKLHLHGYKRSLTIRQNHEGTFDTNYSHYRMVFHGLPFVPTVLYVDGKEVEFERKKKTVEAWVNKDFIELNISHLTIES